MELEVVTETASMPSMSEDIRYEVEGMDAIGREDEEGGFGEEGEIEETPAELLQLLEGKAGSGTEVGKPLERIAVEVAYHERGVPLRIKCWCFDTAEESNSSSKDWEMMLSKQAKLRLLETIGNCKSLRDIEVAELSWQDLSTLLMPMQLNPALNSISICSFGVRYTYESTDLDRTYEILGRILHTNDNLKTLELDVWELTAAAAYHLALGLRGNDKSALEHLRLRVEESVEPSVVTQVAEIVQSAPKLSELALRGAWVLDSDSSDTLANALAQSSSLKSLLLDDVYGEMEGASALLLKALTGKGSNNSITSLQLDGVMDGIEEALPLLLSSNHSLKDFHREVRDRMKPEEGQSLGQSFASSSSLEIFVIQISCDHVDGVEDLLTAADVKKPFVKVYMIPPRDFRDPWPSKFEWKDEEADELLRVTKRPILELHLNGRNSGSVETIIQALRNSSTLRILTLGGATYEPREWKRLVDYLHVNTSITHLGFIECDGLDEDIFKQFMGVLQVNLTLKRVRLTGISWEIDGKKALIEEALKRNAERDSYLSVFRRQALPFHPAKNGRLFLCGSPLAGKTRLRHTMIRSSKVSAWLGDKAIELLRTEGIEVEFLKNDEEMQLAIWDLAGQWIFRTLQDILFPRTNQASIFLFMFSPYDRKNCCIKSDLDQSLKSELEEWLRFIASNSQVSREMLPKVVVVMSHMDKMKERDVSWAESIIAELREEYKCILDICNDKLYSVDARRKKEVGPLEDFIVETFRELLSHKTPPAPKVCSKISSILAKRTKNIKYRPVWSFEEFYSFCFNNLQGDINQSLRPETSSGLQVFEAMTSYLHDIGSVVIIHSLDRIIVDPNWLTNVFLGELITMGHNFDVKGSVVQKQKRVSSKTGFVSYSDLQFLFSSFLKLHHRYEELDRNFLEKLLIHFDLCYKIEDGPANSRYYIPTLVCEDARFKGLIQRTNTGVEPLSWSFVSERSQEFIGFRVQCDNAKRMSMTDALYPRFQIHLRHKLIKEMHLTEEDVVCSRNYMHLLMDGHEVFVERSDMAKSHIDVMVKCSEHKSREIAVKDIEKHILDEFLTFCASPKGCPGVALVVGILQTKCVEKLVPLEYRGDKQVVLIQTLKENFEEYIMKRLDETKVESWIENDFGSLLNYELSWPAIPEFLPSFSELAKKLLPESEVENVTKKILGKHEQHLNQVDQISEELNAEINQEQSALEMVSTVGTLSRASEVEDPSSSSSNIPSRSYTSRVLSSLGHKIEEGFDKVHERFDRVEVTLRRIEGNMNQIISLQHQIQSSLSTFMSKVDKVIGYAESEERTRTPKRPYLSSSNISLYQKVIAKMHLGTPVRLHLMCESMSGPHIIQDQVGLNLCLEKKNMEWLRCIYHISSRVLYCLIKAGLHVTLGLGQAVPELDSLGTTLPVSIATVAVENLPTDDGMVSLEKSATMTLKEAWIHLRSCLAPYLNDRYTELFKLYRVKYRNLDEGGYAWVCDQCMMRGIRNGTLEYL